MCSIKRTYIPEKHRDFWDVNYNDLLRVIRNNETLEGSFAILFFSIQGR